MKAHDLGLDAFDADASEPCDRNNLASRAQSRRAARSEAKIATELRMRLWALDARVADAAVLVDGERLRTILYEAAQLGGATVVGEEFCIFPNGGVTGVLVLAQSHLSIHTWPEHLLANVDLLSCGDLPGERMLHVVGRRLGAEDIAITSMPRGPL